jgi:hypothetical protein
MGPDYTRRDLLPPVFWASILAIAETAGRIPLPRFIILKSARFRLVARVFAVLLLAWTTVDLCGGVCVHDHEPITLGMPGGPDGGRSVSGTDPCGGTCPQSGPDDCFCCSHYVQPQVRYQVVPARAFVAGVAAEPVSRPQFPSSPLYHPPLL